MTEAEFWDDLRRDPLDVASAMSVGCPRVMKTHLSFDMLPDEVMRKRNKVREFSTGSLTNKI